MAPLHYFIYEVGSRYSLFFSISKCICDLSNTSKLAVFPTVPIVCPLVTFSPTFTNSAVNKFEYLVSNPFTCSIITVSPYLGSFFIDFTVPSDAAFTTVVNSACMSTPVCVVHSFNVSEYIRFSLLYSFIISPSTGFINLGSGIITGASCFFTSGAFVSVFCLFSVFV